jgi:hypothetical protein
MFKIKDYIDAILNTFYYNNLALFAIAVILFQVIDLRIKNSYDILVYQVATFTTLYSFINLQLPAYKMFMGGLVATFVSYFIYNQMVEVFKNTNIILLNIVTFISVLIIMTVLNCVSLPAVAYTLMSYKNIPTSKTNYLTSYIVGTVVIYFLGLLLYFAGTYVHSHFIPGNHPYTNLESNLSNWRIISNLNSANQKIIQPTSTTSSTTSTSTASKTNSSSNTTSSNTSSNASSNTNKNNKTTTPSTTTKTSSPTIVTPSNSYSNTLASVPNSSTTKTIPNKYPMSYPLPCQNINGTNNFSNNPTTIPSNNNYAAF